MGMARTKRTNQPGFGKDNVATGFEELLESREFLENYEDAEIRADTLRKLLDVRTTAKRSQKEVARAMGTTQSAVSELEGGVADPRLSTLQRYARAVGAHIDLIVVTVPEMDHIPLTTVTESLYPLVALQQPIDFDHEPELVARAS
jgi:transcriptional regulator with XRE-family HTH domain